MGKERVYRFIGPLSIQGAFFKMVHQILISQFNQRRPLSIFNITRINAQKRGKENLWKTVTENVGFIVVIAITAAVLFAVAKLGEMWAGVTSSQQMRTKKIVTIGMMSALAFILQIFDFPVPFAPPFYKLDFSEVPVLICSFAMGPVAGVASELLKNVLKVLFRGTTTAFVGDYANFVIGCSFIIPAAILYFKHKTKKTAIIGCVAGTIIIAIFGSLFNAFYLLPAFSKLYGMPLESILEMGHAIFSGFEEFNILTFVALCVAPLNLLKGALVSVIVMLIYKPISRILHQV